jgi:hypothetical protein
MAGMALGFYKMQNIFAYSLGKPEEEEQSGQSDSTGEVRQLLHFG